MTPGSAPITSVGRPGRERRLSLRSPGSKLASHSSPKINTNVPIPAGDDLPDVDLGASTRIRPPTYDLRS
jgi:hypothetical protein